MPVPPTVAEQQTESTLERTDPTLIRLRDLIYKVCGIYLPDNKFYFLNDRSDRRIKALKLDSLRSYYEALTTGPDREAEIRSLFNEITVGETCFFRNPQQLAALRKVVLPKIMESKSKLSFTRLKIWSAGSSTGEEPYTLAMMFLEDSGSQLKGWTWEIVATDLNDHSLAKCREASLLRLCGAEYANPIISRSIFSSRDRGTL